MHFQSYFEEINDTKYHHTEGIAMHWLHQTMQRFYTMHGWTPDVRLPFSNQGMNKVMLCRIIRLMP